MTALQIIHVILCDIDEERLKFSQLLYLLRNDQFQSYHVSTNRHRTAVNLIDWQVILLSLATARMCRGHATKTWHVGTELFETSAHKQLSCRCGATSRASGV